VFLAPKERQMEQVLFAAKRDVLASSKSVIATAYV